MPDYRSGKPVMDPPAGHPRFFPQEVEPDYEEECEEMTTDELQRFYLLINKYTDPVRTLREGLATLISFTKMEIDEDTEILNYLLDCMTRILTYLED